jgi:membrane protease YdiL (CAAX protease family)
VAATADEPSATRGWSPWSAPLALIIGFVAAVVGAVVVGVIGSIAGASVNHPPPSVQIVDTVIQDGALVGAVIFVARSFGSIRPADFGLVLTRFWPAIWRMIAAGGAFLGFLLLWSAALNLHNKEKLLDQLGANKSTVAAAAVALLVCVIAPFSEEFVFRGYFFEALRNWRGPWVAAALTGIVFGSIHAGSAPAGYLVPLAFFGFVLSVLRWRTGSLWPGIALHSINNSVALGAGLGWGWQIPVVIVGALGVLAGVALAIDRTIAQPVAAH